MGGPVNLCFVASKGEALIRTLFAVCALTVLVLSACGGPELRGPAPLAAPPPEALVPPDQGHREAELALEERAAEEAQKQTWNGGAPKAKAPSHRDVADRSAARDYEWPGLNAPVSPGPSRQSVQEPRLSLADKPVPIPQLPEPKLQPPPDLPALVYALPEFEIAQSAPVPESLSTVQIPIPPMPTPQQHHGAAPPGAPKAIFLCPNPGPDGVVRCPILASWSPTDAQGGLSPIALGLLLFALFAVLGGALYDLFRAALRAPRHAPKLFANASGRQEPRL
jgi:hypothetical protein